MVRKLLVWLSLGVIFTVGILGVLLVLSGFPFKYMDLNDSGFVSFGEAIRTLDLGVRETTDEGDTCIEIFSLKDGLPIKLVCDDT